jgi:hypothetical protein
MIESIIGLVVGYFLGHFISMLGRPQLDRLLVWDRDVFAWRVVPFGSRLDISKKYLVATELILNNEEVDAPEF